MRRILSLAILILAPGLAWAGSLEPGARAPAFSLVGSDGKTHSLEQYLGKQGVVLAWFPKAFTPG